MEKIKLSSGTEFEIITNGVFSNGKTLAFNFLPGDLSLDEINTLFTNTKETKQITLLSESEVELAIYNRFIQLDTITQQVSGTIGYEEDGTPITGKLVTVNLSKPDSLTGRVLDLETQVTELQEALVEIYESGV